MFYAHFILKKRGPLSRIWLAAHWDKKLTKAHIFETDIEGSVAAILSPQLKLALRTSSHLLLGVVRIYSRKAKYLLADCNEAFVKIKLAFRPGMVDLPAENREASLTTINIREDFTSFDLDVPDFNEIDFHARFAVNQSRPEDITMREEVACLPFVGDDGFVDNDYLGGPITIQAVEQLLREFSTCIMTPQKMKRNASTADSGFGSPSFDRIYPFSEFDASPSKTALSVLRQGSGDFGFNPGMNTISEVNLDDILFEQQNMDQIEVQPTELLREQEARHSEDELGKMGAYGAQDLLESRSVDDDDDCNDEDACEDDGSVANSYGATEDHKLFGEGNVLNQKNQQLYEEEPTVVNDQPHSKASVSATDFIVLDAFCEKPCEGLTHPKPQAVASKDLTTLIENDAEAFTLGPVEVNLKERKTKRKRRLIVDEHKVISSETMKSQLSDSSDLIIPLDLAPPTKKLMQWKESGGVDKLFVLPGKPLVHKRLCKLFSRNLCTTQVLSEDGETAGLEDSVVEDENRPAELRRGDAREINVDASQELSESLFSVDLPDKNHNLQGDVSSNANCSLSLLVDDSILNQKNNVSDKRKPMTEEDILCIDQLPDVPSVVEDDLVAEAGEDSPKCKHNKQSSHSATASKKSQPPPPAATSAAAATSDFEDAENEDAIFDVELPPACSERTDLHQELEESAMEERLWNQRSTQMKHILQRKLETTAATSFKQLTNRNNRKQAASKFYTILVLTKAFAIHVRQQEPFGDIEIRRGPAFSGII